MRTNSSPHDAGVFSRFARHASRVAGNPLVFLCAIGLVLAWAILGPVFGFSDSWQLMVNTATTIATFLMVFLIQNTQNRDTEAMHLKLDELIRSTKAQNALLDIEDLDEREMELLHKGYQRLAERARQDARDGAGTAGGPGGETRVKQRRRRGGKAA